MVKSLALSGSAEKEGTVGWGEREGEGRRNGRREGKKRRNGREEEREREKRGDDCGGIK